MQFNKSWAQKKLPRSAAWLRRCWRRSKAESLSLIRGNLQMRRKMQQRSVSFKSVFPSATCWCSAGRFWEALGVLWSPGENQQALGKHQLVCWRCCCSQIPAPSPCWFLVLLTAEWGGKGLCVCMCLCTAAPQQQLPRKVHGRAGIAHVSVIPPASSAMGTAITSRERKLLTWKKWQPNSHSLVNMSQNMRHKDRLLQNRLPRFNNEKQRKSRQRQT